MKRGAAVAAFPAALAGFGPDVLVVGHNDADGLSATAILALTLKRLGREPSVRLLGKGENAWSPEFLREVRSRPIDGLIVTDLGVREERIRPGVPTILIDHHVPSGRPVEDTVVTGIDEDPVPTSSLLAYRCARTVGDAEGLLWLAALGIIGDMAEKADFPEMLEARRHYGVTALRDATALVNAPRRSASGDAAPAFALLMKASGPKAVLSGEHAETAALFAAREEVKRELDAARRVGPKMAGRVALIRFHSPCQIHPLVAQAWRGRLKDRIVIAANTGYRPGWVHFATRTALEDVDLIEFLREVAPPGADESYGNGHRQATGGALRAASWNAFARNLGFGPEMGVPEDAAVAA